MLEVYLIVDVKARYSSYSIKFVLDSYLTHKLKATFGGTASQSLTWFCHHSWEHTEYQHFHCCIFCEPDCQLVGLLPELNRFVSKQYKPNYHRLTIYNARNKHNSKIAIFY